MFDIQSFFDCNSRPNSSLLIYVFKQKIDVLILELCQRKIAKNNHAILVRYYTHLSSCFRNAYLINCLKIDWLDYLCQYSRRFGLKCVSKALTPKKTEKSEGKKSAFGKVPIDISKISVKILLLPNCFLYLLILQLFIGVSLSTNKL